MSADLLREAATAMREEAQMVRRPYGRAERVAEAVADWLDSEDTHQFGPTEHAINVALAYLGRAS